MDNKLATYLTSPLANSTKIQNTVNNNCTDMSLREFKKQRTMPLNIQNKNYIEIKSTSIDISSTPPTTPSINRSNSTTLLSKTTATRKSVGGKKPMVSKKSVTVKKTLEPIKVITKNYNYESGISVERILKQINMTKYHQAFKKIDIAKFKDMKEIDLNAIGITRPSEIRSFMDAINKVKSNMIVFKQN